jgi:TonB family protein
MRLSFGVILLSALSLAAADDWRDWLNRGTEAYENERYREAVENLQKSVHLNPNEIEPRLYLATAWMSLYVPGSASRENLDIQRNAETEFNRVLQLDPNNLTALQCLASLSYQQAQGITEEVDKFRKLDEAASWYQKILAADPRETEAYYSLAVIDWIKWYSNWMRARPELGMHPEDSGPLTNVAVRQDLLARYSSLIADAMANLEKALELDPQNTDVMSYMNLLIRERADLKDTPAEYERDIETADQWVQKALDTMERKPASATPPAQIHPPPPPDGQQTPQPIHVGSVLTTNLIRRVPPVYPQEAKAAHIEGTVRFTATIGKDGRILDLQVVSGHPLLAKSALAAVRQWEYKPTLLNGQPVEIITTIDVNFNLSQ